MIKKKTSMMTKAAGSTLYPTMTQRCGRKAEENHSDIWHQSEPQHPYPNQKSHLPIIQNPKPAIFLHIFTKTHPSTSPFSYSKQRKEK